MLCPSCLSAVPLGGTYCPACGNNVRLPGHPARAFPEPGTMRSTNRSVERSVLLGAPIAVVIGSLGPWASVLFFTVSGYQTNSGKETLALGALGFVCALASIGWPRSWVASLPVLGCMLAAGCIGAVNWADLQRLVASSDGLASVDWGLVVATLAAWAGVAAGVAAMFRSHGRRRLAA